MCFHFFYTYIIIMYIYLFIKFPPDLGLQVRFRAFVACLARNAAICCILARNGCSSPPGSRRRFEMVEPAPGPQMVPQMLEMAARARPGAADGSEWPREPAPGPQMGPQMARNGRSSLPQSRRILDKCRPSLPWSRRMLDGRLSSLPGTAECSTGAARAWSRRMLDGGRSSMPWSSSMRENCRSSPQP